MSTTKTGIEWTDRTWNPVRGCSRISEGCRHCYAETIAARFSDEGQAFHLFAERGKSGSKWSGKVELVESALLEPLSWRKPARVFANSMSDLFHESLPDESIHAVLAVISQAKEHTFQVLTKRAPRMRTILSDPDLEDKVDEAGARAFAWCHANADGRFPLPNLHLGVSVEGQPAADPRIRELLQTPAAVRFVSYEPALEAVDLKPFLSRRISRNWPPLGLDEIPGSVLHDGCTEIWTTGLNWLIVGGESGPDARPFDVEWARSAVRQCKAAGVACFVKQLGRVPMMREDLWRACNPMPLLSVHNHRKVPEGFVAVQVGDKKGGDWDLWPSALHDLKVREFPTHKGTHA